MSTKDNGGKKDYIATLKYFPAEMHNNKDLRCQVTHQAYSAVQTAEKANEAQLVLKISCKYKELPFYFIFDSTTKELLFLTQTFKL